MTSTPTVEHPPGPADRGGGISTASAAPTSWGAVLEVLAPVRGRLLAALLLVVVSTAAGLAPVLGIVELGRTLLPATSGAPVDAGRAWAVVWVVVAALALRLVTLTAAAYLSHQADLDVSLSIRRALVDRLGRIPLAWFTDRSSGRVKKAVQDDVAALHQLVAHAVLELTGAVTTPVVVLVYLFTISWPMTLITLVPLLLGVLGYAVAMRGGAQKFAEYDAAMAEMGSSAVEFVHGISVVKTFGQAGRAHRRFAGAASRFTSFYGGWMRHSALGMLVMDLALSPVATLVTAAVGGVALVQASVIAPVDVLAFVVLGLTITAPVTTAGYSAQALREALQAAGRISSLLHEPELPQPSAEAAGAPEGHRVELRGVDFAYGDPGPRGENLVLRDVSATLEPGTVTALVGPSGSGKSTLATLLPRFADPVAGSVTIGGVDLRDVPSARLYEQVSFVFQDVSLLRTTVAQNIALARPDASDEEVRAAARAAQVHDRITALPRGYDSVVGEDALLSGGERQRVSIARALLAGTPVLVLDEATASADPESEALVQEALGALVAGRTLLVIAHRLSTITGADQILVLDGGRVVERGTHEQLLAADGRYALMWRSDQRSSRAPRERAVATTQGGSS